MRRLCLILSVLSCVLLCAPAPASAIQVPRISPQELNALLNTPDLVILDVRRGGQWDRSATMIKGANRVQGDIIKETQQVPKSATVVIYCG